MAELYGNEAASTIRQTQVYQATHGGDGSRLPFMNRSFTSFSYGGKNIEDFNLIATTSGNRMEKDAYATFNDTTSTYDNLDGLQYWSTHYKAGTVEFTLATDGMDQRQLDNFKNWFAAGVCRELILAEHPNRALLARVSESPKLHLLGFEQDIEIKIASVTRKTKTTLYKGEITLKFVMDSPHWYSRENLLGRKIDGQDRYIDEWIDANGEAVNIFSSKDALKILYEDGIPLASMIQKNMLLGNGGFANVEDQPISSIWYPERYAEDIQWTGTPFISEPLEEGRYGMRIEANNATYPYTRGVIAGAIVDATGDGIVSLPSLNDASSGSDPHYGLFYYSGTAPAPTIIRFTMSPKIDDSTGYVVLPCNAKSVVNASDKPYSTITIEGIEKQELRFTTPNLYTSYNKAIEIFKAKGNSSFSWEQIREAIRDEVRHKAVREWAIKIIDASNTSLATPSATELINYMKYMLLAGASGLGMATFTFNSETGEAKGLFSYRLVTDSSMNLSSISTYGDRESFTTGHEIEEDVGDMLRSNYIIIRDRNMPNEEGYITDWSQENPTNAHRIYHDLELPLTNLSILYKNMYL